MNRAGQVFLFIAVVLWATLIGGIMYSHTVFFPPYLSHLPESTHLINGPYAVKDENFWKPIHPVVILFVIASLISNWKAKDRRKYVLISLGIYALALIATFVYFVPELKAFAESSQSNISASEWFHRGQNWQHLSWVRGFFMYLAFIFLLLALTKNKQQINSRFAS